MNETNSGATQALRMREKICYGCGGAGNAIVLAVVSTFLMFFYTDVAGLNSSIVGSLILVSKIFDGISDLVMGRIVDQTNSRFGKARCWILWLSIPYAVSGVLLFLLQSSWPDTIKYVYVFITYNLVNSIFFTGVCVPYNAMNALLTNRQYDRGVLGTTNVMGNVAGQLLVNTFMMSLVGFFGNNQNAWTLASAVFGIIGIIMHLICFTQTTERNGTTQTKEAEPNFLESIQSLFRNKYWLMVTCIALIQYFVVGVGFSSMMYYAKLIVGDENQVSVLTNPMNYAQIVMYFLAFIFIKKLGKGGSFRVGFSIATLSYILQIFAGANTMLLVVCGVIRGLGVGMGAACLGGMISDTIEYGEWKTGLRCVGVGNAANSFGQKIGNGVGTAAVGWVLNAAGYDGSVTAAATGAVKMLYTYIPIVCCIAIVIIACSYNLDKIYPDIIADLQRRKEHRQ